LREVVPAAVCIAVFVNPTNPTTEAGLRDVEQAARAIGLQIQVFNVSSVHDIDTAFVTLATDKADALFVARTRCSSIGVCNWRNGRLTSRCRQSIKTACSSKPAG
jgi:ABC-type uncharacterized transport system substrate-binding protein